MTRIGRLTSHHVATRGPPDRHRIEGLEMHQTAAIVRNHDLRIAIGRCEPFAAESILFEPTMIARTPGSRSTHNRGPIAVRSLPDRGAILAKIGGFLTVKSGQNRREIEALSSPIGTAPTTLANRLHDRSNDPRSSDQFPL